MSLKVLTTTIMDLKKFFNKRISLKDADNGTIALMNNNKPAMYLLSPKRLSKLLEIELKYLQQNLDFCKQKKIFQSVNNDMSYQNIKFRMHKNWIPGNNFIKLSALWGIKLNFDITKEELRSFISYWQVENKMFYHVQWQQKLARIIQLNRKQYFYKKNKFKAKDINDIPKPDKFVPYGFKG